MKSQKVRVLHVYIVASAAAADGHGGCQLWISKSIPYAIRHNVALTIGEDSVSILHGDPRRLIVHVSGDSLQLQAVVLHAPDQNSKPDATIWWDETEAL
eukprot:2316928-Karenia_brevis.AAC.1